MREKNMNNGYGKILLFCYIQLASAADFFSFVWILCMSLKRTVCFVAMNPWTVYAAILSESSHNIYSQKFVI